MLCKDKKYSLMSRDEAEAVLSLSSTGNMESETCTINDEMEEILLSEPKPLTIDCTDEDEDVRFNEIRFTWPKEIVVEFSEDIDKKVSLLCSVINKETGQPVGPEAVQIMFATAKELFNCLSGAEMQQIVDIIERGKEV